MKKLTTYILLSVLLLMAAPALSIAQVNININEQPAWGPSGYNRADYYYLPDVESYYSVATHQFIYLSNGRWIYAPRLQPQYKNYDLYSGYKVVVNRPRPFLNFSEDRVQYNKFKNWKGRQENIRDSHKNGKQRSILKSNAKKHNNTGDYGP
jgi:hypothetical protein